MSRSSAVLGSMVGIKPIIRVNEEGKLEVIGKVRGRKKAIQTIIKDLMERIRDGEKTVFISHGDCLEEAEAIKQKLITDYGMDMCRSSMWDRLSVRIPVWGCWRYLHWQIPADD